MTWPTLVALAVGVYGLKLFGVVALSRLLPPDADPATDTRLLPAMAALIPAALFTALLAVQTVELAGALALDARAAGVAASAVAVWRRAPFIVVIVVAMTVTALIRWQTSG